MRREALSNDFPSWQPTRLRWVCVAFLSCVMASVGRPVFGQEAPICEVQKQASDAIGNPFGPPVKIPVVISGPKSRILRKSCVTIKTEQDFVDVWRVHVGKSDAMFDMPKVDYTRNEVLAIFAGRSSSAQRFRIFGAWNVTSSVVVQFEVVATGGEHSGGSSAFAFLILPRLQQPLLAQEGRAKGPSGMEWNDWRVSRSLPFQGPEKGQAIAPAARSSDPGVRIWTVRQANFTKDFGRAVSGAEALLADSAFRGKGYEPLRCDALLQLCFAQYKLGREKLAQRAYERFLEQSVGFSRDHALLHQMAEIRRAFNGDTNALELATRTVHIPAADEDWRSVDVDSTEIDALGLADLARVSRAAGGDAFLVLHDGKIVLEEYGPSYREPMFTMSSVKSMTGLLVGLAIEDGKLDNVNVPVSAFFPEWKGGLRGDVTVEHLLTMCSGMLRARSGGVPSATDKNLFVRGLEPSAKPGSRWSYSNEGVQLLGALIQEAVGEPLADYARRRLFMPLGMRDTQMRKDGSGNAIAYADARTTLRDFARLGVVMSQGGQWMGKQVIPADWVQSSLKPCAKHKGYGYLWWLHEHGCFAMQGYLGTSVWIRPSKKLVIARVQSRPSLLANAPFDDEAFRRLIARL